MLIAVLDVASILPTVSCDVVAISESPSADDVMMEFGEKSVELVPPLDIGSVPIHVGVKV